MQDADSDRRLRWRTIEYCICETGEYLVRLPQFQASIGAGKTLEEALESMESVVLTWVEVFAEANGVAALAKRIAYERD